MLHPGTVCPVHIEKLLMQMPFPIESFCAAIVSSTQFHFVYLFFFLCLLLSLMVHLCRMPITWASSGNILTIMLHQRVLNKWIFYFSFLFANIDWHFKCDAVHSLSIRTANKLLSKEREKKIVCRKQSIFILFQQCSKSSSSSSSGTWHTFSIGANCEAFT